MSKGLVTKKRIGVLMGGQSSERDVSIRTGLAIYQSLEERGYNSVLIDAGKDVMQVLRKEKVRIAFLALHGGTGENGAIQGMLEVMGIPYTGSGVLASALAINKEVSKILFTHHGITGAPHIIVRKSRSRKKRVSKDEPQKGEMDITGAYVFPDIPEPSFALPWVVKPASEGSSIGVTIVKDTQSLHSYLEKAFEFGERAIIEKYIQGKELHIAILGDTVLGGVEVRPSLEFYNYEAKYTSGLTEYIMPPDVDETTLNRVKDMALKAHRCLGCTGATRVDFMVDEQGEPYILEVNTLPGMTKTSLLPKIAESGGMTFIALVEEMLRLAIKE